MSITLKTPEEIEKMRVAGRLAGEVLDYITPLRQAGRHHRRTGPALPRLHGRCAGLRSGPAQLRAARLHALPQVDLHLGQPSGLPRRPERQAAEEGRHRQSRHHDHQGRLPRRHQPHVRGGGEASILAKRLCEITYECLWLGIAQVRPGAHLGDIGARHPAACRKERLLRGARVLRPRHRAQASTKSRRFCTTARPAPASNWSRA